MLPSHFSFLIILAISQLDPTVSKKSGSAQVGRDSKNRLNAPHEQQSYYDRIDREDFKKYGVVCQNNRDCIRKRREEDRRRERELSGESDGFVEIIESQVNLEILTQNLKLLTSSKSSVKVSSSYLCDDPYCQLPVGVCLRTVSLLVKENTEDVTIGIFERSENGEFTLIETFHHKPQDHANLIMVPLRYEVEKDNLFIGFICDHTQENCPILLTPINSDMSFISMPYKESSVVKLSEQQKLTEMVPYELHMVMSEEDASNHADGA